MKEVLIVGCGYMGKEYAKVLKAQNINMIVVGRGEESAKIFTEEMGIPVITGGLESAVKILNGKIPSFAIIAVGVDQLKINTELLLKNGVKNILVEKPAGLNEIEIKELGELAEYCKANIYVAYNRRFYAATEKAMEIIMEDGGVSSFTFEFTEWSSTIESSKHPAIVKENWILANSSHVIDLAFFLGGKPKEIKSYVSGELSWHHNGSVYVGAGVTEKGALFSYQANWEAPGRWGVEILTKKHRLYFRPMEKLQIQNINSVKIDDVTVDYDLDQQFKPGLYKQVKAFLSDGKDEKLLTIQEQLEHVRRYAQIAGI